MNVASPGVPQPYQPGQSGIVCVNKPLGMTSHDVVSRCRKIFSTKKVGHAGTLDPAATGMLVLGIGRATKFLTYLIVANKKYEATIRLGRATDSDDATGEPLQHVFPRDITTLTDQEIREHTTQFQGTIMQAPANISAIKIGGKRAYERMRAGEVFTLPEREVTVHEITVTTITRGDNPYPYIDVGVNVFCSSGTFIRSIARDLGNNLGVGGHITQLHRSTISNFNHMHTLEELQAHPTIDSSLNDIAQHSYPTRRLTSTEADNIMHGRYITASKKPEHQGIYCGIDEHNTAVALLENQKKNARSLFIIDPDYA